MNRQKQSSLAELEHLPVDDAAVDVLTHNVALTPIRRLVLMLLQRHPEVAGYQLDRSTMEIGAVCPDCTRANTAT